MKPEENRVTDLQGLRTALRQADAIGRALHDELEEEPEIKRGPE
jgi:hypothetical protein